MYESASKKHWLGVLEALALGTTVGGSVAAGVLNQSFLFSAPLSLTLCLSLLNRRRINAAIQQNNTQELEQLRRDFYQLDRFVLEALQSTRWTALPAASPEQADGTPIATTDPLTARQPIRLIEPDVLAESDVLSPDLPSAEPSILDAVAIDSMVTDSMVSSVTDGMVPDELADRQLTPPTTIQPPEFIAQFHADISQLQADLRLLSDQFIPTVTQLQYQLTDLSQQISTFSQEYEIAALAQTIASLDSNISPVATDSSSKESETHRDLDTRSVHQDEMLDDLPNHLVALQQNSSPKDLVPSWSLDSDAASQEFDDLVDAIVQLEQAESDDLSLKQHRTVLTSAMYTV